jgi:Fe-S oxidoreductase
MNLRDVLPGAAKLSEAIAGFSAQRTLPKWRSDWFRDDDSRPPPPLAGEGGEGEAPDTETADLPPPARTDLGFTRDRQNYVAQVGQARLACARPSPASGGGENREVILFVDTFNRYFERENIDAALAVLAAANYRVTIATPADGSSRPLCCGRTFLSVGAVEEAKHEAERTLAALASHVARGVPVVGLEPSCILGFRDEVPAIIKDARAQALAGQAVTFEEFLARERSAGRLELPLAPLATTRALVHGHCHQKSFDAFAPVEAVLRLVPDLKVETIESSCCGMAGAFGYAADTIDASRAMGELALLPAVRQAPDDAIIVADGTSCRHQIHDGGGREAVHVARVLQQSLANARTSRRT